MTEEWSVPVWAAVALPVGGLLVLGLLALALVLGVLRPARRRLAEQQAVADALLARLTDLEARLDEQQRPAVATEQEYRITRLGDEQPDGTDEAGLAPESRSAPTVPAPLFADMVLRESAVQAVTLAAGLRRALAPETRNRIRFEMRREVRRARKQRRADLREARREWQARQRESLDGSAA